jgi:hypothetical protein
VWVSRLLNDLDAVLESSRRTSRKRVAETLTDYALVGAFPDGQSALNLAAAAARRRHRVVDKAYLNMELLKDHHMKGAITA